MVLFENIRLTELSVMFNINCLSLCCTLPIKYNISETHTPYALAEIHKNDVPWQQKTFLF